ncbi:MAG TPA: metal ABC transporter ATP-binding protein [Planctomycetota bacterium]|nr:metal ABC transporter ATP-binding protein [Planctomycetota bacterium]
MSVPQKTPVNATSVIELRGVKYAYGDGPNVLDGVDFKVRDGEFLGVIGPNGGGKTTLLKLILGLMRPLEGTVSVLGKAAADLGHDRRLLGYVPQDVIVRKQFPATVLDVCLMGTYASLGLLRWPGATERANAKQALHDVGLEGLEERLAGNLSGGQQQRLSIARALVAQPRLLLLDEPTSGLDTGGQAQLFTLLEKLRKQYHLTVVMVSHDVTALAHYADELACLNRTLHWHDRSELISEAVLRKVYACELDAFFIQHQKHLEEFHGDHAPAGHAHGPHCSHDHGHSHGDHGHSHDDHGHSHGEGQA